MLHRTLVLEAQILAILPNTLLVSKVSQLLRPPAPSRIFRRWRPVAFLIKPKPTRTGDLLIVDLLSTLFYRGVFNLIKVGIIDMQLSFAGFQ